MMFWTRLKRRWADLCEDCGEPLQRRVWEDEILTEKGQAKVLLSHVPYRGCGREDHRKSTIDSNWWSFVMEGFPEKVPVYETRKTQCAECGAKLSEPDTPASFRIVIESNGAPPPTLVMEVPSRQCSRCQTVNAEVDGLCEDGTLALRRALASINLRQ